MEIPVNYIVDGSVRTTADNLGGSPEGALLTGSKGPIFIRISWSERLKTRTCVSRTANYTKFTQWVSSGGGGANTRQPKGRET
jgi:hypothetical protein